MNENDWRAEQQRVEKVTRLMMERMAQLEAEVGQVRTDVVSIRKHFWDEVSINLSNADDIVETHFSIRQQAEVLSERERRYRQSAATLNTLKRLVQSPYFGRIDFKEDGSQETDEVYLGIGSFKDDDDTFLVYDWRAPISSLYYDYGPGPVSYKAPFGEVTGTMLLKRQYTIRDAQIRFMFDTGVTIGDEMLMQVLSRHSDAQMKSIVATIQKEQNRIIRNDHSRLLIVQGAAGSGKTSAALQRVAYLLYKYRETLQADQMVLFSPNPLFNSYVSTVLPELGEQNMQQATFQEYLEHRLGKEFTLEDPFSQIEYILTSGDEADYATRLSGISYKSSVAYLNAIRAYRDVLEQEGMIFVPVVFRGREIITSDQIREQFYSFDASVRLANRMELVREWILKQISAFEEAEMREEWVEEEINLLEPEDYQRAYNQLRRVQKRKSETFDDYDKEKEILSKMVIQRHLKPVRRRIKRLRFVDVTALYRQLFENAQLLGRLSGNKRIPRDWSEICRQTLARLSQSELAYEDATPFLYLKEMVQGLHANTTVRHVIVDEAQDYSPFQLEFLKRLFPRGRMTALGDLNQAIYAHESAFKEFDALVQLYGADQTEVIRLTKSYRSTREIVEFTQGMVAGGNEIEPFNRRGDKPQVIPVSDRTAHINKIVSDINALRADGYESIAVVCKTAQESTNAYEALRDRVSLRLVTKYTPTFEKEALVIPAYLAKGVEFDAVIIFDGSIHTYCRDTERKLFYTACTRAMHLLHIYSLGEPSSFITDQDADTYAIMS